jgi:GAF domain-containing protein
VLYNEFVRTEWGLTAQHPDQSGFRYHSGRIEMIDTRMTDPESTSAALSGEVATTRKDQGEDYRPAIAVPVKLHGEVIGILRIESNDGTKLWRGDELSLIQAVAERAALALENARLFQDARRRATKERLIAEATSRIGGSLNIENILENTAVELERVLGGSEVLIRFNERGSS